MSKTLWLVSHPISEVSKLLSIFRERLLVCDTHGSVGVKSYTESDRQNTSNCYLNVSPPHLLNYLLFGNYTVFVQNPAFLTDIQEPRSSSLLQSLGHSAFKGIYRLYFLWDLKTQLFFLPAAHSSSGTSAGPAGNPLASSVLRLHGRGLARERAAAVPGPQAWSGLRGRRGPA